MFYCEYFGKKSMILRVELEILLLHVSLKPFI